MVALLRTGADDLGASSPALCSLDQTYRGLDSSEGPCSSESEQSCLFRSQSRSLLVDNCCSESLGKSVNLPKSAKRKRAEDLLARNHKKSHRNLPDLCSTTLQRSCEHDAAVVPPCPAGQCDSRYPSLMSPRTHPSHILAKTDVRNVLHACHMRCI